VYTVCASCDTPNAWFGCMYSAALAACSASSARRPPKSCNDTHMHTHIPVQYGHSRSALVPCGARRSVEATASHSSLSRAQHEGTTIVNRASTTVHGVLGRRGTAVTSSPIACSAVGRSSSTMERDVEVRARGHAFTSPCRQSRYQRRRGSGGLPLAPSVRELLRLRPTPMPSPCSRRAPWRLVHR
jgi:hypothetical protein